MQGQPTEEQQTSPPVAPAQPRLACLDCGIEIPPGDLSHVNHAVVAARQDASKLDRIQSVALDLVSHQRVSARISTGVAGFDRVLGGGLVRNGIVMLDGEPGIGKSTLLSSAAGRIAARGGNVLYASGEETAEQVAACAHRIGHAVEGVRVISTASLETILRETRLLEQEGWPIDVLIADSAQALSTLTVSSPVGSVYQVGAVTNELRAFAKSKHVAVILVSQVTKDGTAAGPKQAAHAVDALLSFGRDDMDVRWLRSSKNRFGAVGEVAQFEMSATGLREVDDPTLVAWRELVGEPGVAACVAAHLAKPVVVPVEALVTQEEEGPAGRSVQASGVATERVRFVLESLSRHGGVSFAKCSVRVRVPLVAGAEVSDPALDLAVAAACWSSLHRVSLGRSIFAGAIGLSGKLQVGGRLDARLEYVSRVNASALVIGTTATPRRGNLLVHGIGHASDLVPVLETLRVRERP